MSVFFDELQKQYQNMENKASQAYNTGINMLGQKFNMMNQLFSNKMQTLGTGANILSQASQIPSSMASMFGNMLDAKKSREQQQEQFNMGYGLDKQRLDFAREQMLSDNAFKEAELELQKQKMILEQKLINKQISELDYEKNIKAIDSQYNKLTLFNDYPQAKKRYMQLKQQFPKASETQIAGWLESEGQAGKFTPVLNWWDRMWSGDESTLPQGNFGRTR